MEPLVTIIETYKLGILFAQARTAMISNFVNAAILAYLCRASAPGKALGAWLGGICALSLVRALMNRRLRRRLEAEPTAERVRYTKRHFTIFLSLSGLLWGASCFLVPASEIALQMFIGFVLAGMTAAAVATYSMVPGAVLGFMACSVGVYLVRLLMGSTPLYHGAAFMTVLYLVLISRIIRLLSSHIHKSISLRFENDALLKKLQEQNTELVAVNQELRETKDNLVEAVQMASLGGIAANLAHEINNPMMIVTGRMEQIREKAGATTPLGPWLDSIARAVDRIYKTIQSFRAFSIDNTLGRHELVSVREVIESAVAIYLSRFAEPGINLTVEEIDPGLRVMGDSMLLSHTVFSLMQNAREAVSARGTREPWIRLRVAVQGDEIVVELSDSGGGISAEIRDRIFDPFFSTKDGGRAKGYGLGLTFARNIVAKHNGKLVLVADIPSTTFRLILPKAADANRLAA